MKKDDYIGKDEQKEGTAPGHCMFCGQTYSVGDSVAGMTQEQLDEEATKKCFCSEAKSYVRKNERRKKVDNYLKEVFLGEKVQGTIKQLIESIEGYEIEKATIKTTDGWNTTIYLDKDNYLNIKRKATKAGKELKA